MSGLYIHIPFCKQRCIYCDFYFVTSKKHVDAFVKTLKQEIAFRGTFFDPKQSLETIYFGGGTPSLLPVDAIEDILKTIDSSFDTSRVKERSFELNPDDVDDAYLTRLRKAGINRLSIGTQSFFDADLQWMNRAHNAKQASGIVPMARAAGFENLSVDLIFGLSEQSKENWEHNLELAIASGAPHLSTYSLTIEPRTPLYKQVARGLLQHVDDSILADLYQYTIDRLVAAGYEHYEVSSFSKPGWRSQHNQLYWRHTNYLGVGPSAHSFWQASDMPATRWANVSNIKKYIAWTGRGEPPLSFKEKIKTPDLENEYIMLRLRTSDGLSLQTLKRNYNTELDPSVLEEILDQDFAMINENKTLILTQKGMLVCNTITERLMV